MNPGYRRSYFLGFVIVTAAVCLVLGLVLPVLKLTRLYVWTDTHSLASVIVALAQDNEFFLAGILIVFSVIFPALKILYLIVLYTLPSRPDRQRLNFSRGLRGSENGRCWMFWSWRS